MQVHFAIAKYNTVFSVLYYCMYLCQGGWYLPFLSIIFFLKLLKCSVLLNSSIVPVCQNDKTSIIMATRYIVRLGKVLKEWQTQLIVYRLHTMLTVLTKVLEYKYKYIEEIKKLFNYFIIIKITTKIVHIKRSELESTNIAIISDGTAKRYSVVNNTNWVGILHVYEW